MMYHGSWIRVRMLELCGYGVVLQLDGYDSLYYFNPVLHAGSYCTS
jgi:hypothetical protein